MLEIFFEKKAKERMIFISKNDKSSAIKIDQKIITLSNYPNVSNLWIKKLKGDYGDFFCLKVKDYRIKFKIEDGKILICEIDDRKDAYK